MYQLIIVSVNHATALDFVNSVARGDKYMIVGDYGFVGSFKTRKEAFAYAKSEADAINSQDMILSSLYGNGGSPNNAIADFCKKIQGKYLCSMPCVPNVLNI